MQGSSTFSWGSRPTVDTLGDIVFSSHVAAPELSTWRGRVLFTTRLEIAVRAPRLHTVVRGTPVLGYRHIPNTIFVWSSGEARVNLRRVQLPYDA
jgi:hypothetical protein